MELKVVSVVFLLLCTQVFAVRNLETSVSRSLKQTVGSNATVSLSLDLEGPGTVIAVGQARGDAVAIVRNAFVAAVAQAVADVEGGGNALAIAAIRGEAYGLAVAEAFAESLVSVSSNAPGAVVCISAAAEAQATARAFAAVFVNVLAQASNDISFSQSSAAISAIVSVTVTAYASAASTACGSGVFSVDSYVNVLARQISVPFVQVCALAFALVADGVSVAEIRAIARAGILEVSTVDGRTATEVFGEATGGSDGTGGTSSSGR